jgi:hypothetical protein
VPSNLHAELSIRWEDLSLLFEEKDVVARIGGQLAEATLQGLKLDSAERWLLQDQKADERYPKAVQLYPVLLHEIGHCLGLAHSSRREDIMFPYLTGTKELSANDVARAQALVSPVVGNAADAPAGTVVADGRAANTASATNAPETSGAANTQSSPQATGGVAAGAGEEIPVKPQPNAPSKCGCLLL